MPRIIITDWHTHSSQLIGIRTSVFVDEQQVPLADEWDGLDETAAHFLIKHNGQAVGCARLLVEREGNFAQFHIGRVAILKEFRGNGFGRQLMQFILDYCKRAAPYPIYLHAQVERRNFYKNLGFVEQGAVFMDAGIPHITMHWQSEPRNGGTK